MEHGLHLLVLPGKDHVFERKMEEVVVHFHGLLQGSVPGRVRPSRTCVMLHTALVQILDGRPSARTEALDAAPVMMRQRQDEVNKDGVLPSKNMKNIMNTL